MATIKQRIATRKVVKGMSVSKAMRESGYSKTTARNPDKLTNSKNFEGLLDKYMPENKLLKAGKEGLKAVRPQSTIFDKEGKEIHTNEPDYNARHKYFETGLRLRGKLKENEGQNTLNLQINFDSAFEPKKVEVKEVKDVKR